MKEASLICIFLFSAVQVFSQQPGNLRFYDEVFDYFVTEDIKYGEAPQPKLLNPHHIKELYLDVYQPAGDTSSSRPLVIWAFGGAFVFGNKRSADIVGLCSALAQRGYVCAAIDYRLSTDLVINSETSHVYEAVMKASHDMAASIRFFYKDAATSNEFRIDTTRIYIGGVSSGAITALQLAHFDDLQEVPPGMDSLFQAIGGFEGNSGNEGYSRDIAGVISLCGAILDTAWINLSDTTPIGSMHGTEDGVVPYGSDTITILDIGVEVDGSSTIHHKLNMGGVFNDFHTFQGAGHTPFVGFGAEKQAYMVTTIWFVRDFLYDLVSQDVTSANESLPEEKLSVSVYPNPSEGNFYLHLESVEDLSLTIFDARGKQVFAHPGLSPGLHELKLEIPAGIYTMVVYSEGKRQHLSRQIYLY